MSALGLAARPAQEHDVLPFAFVDAAHPFARAVDEFRAGLAADPVAMAWLADPDGVVHAELKGSEDGRGGFSIDRTYCSVQRARPGFEARSLCFAAKHGRTDRYAFPDEPYLTGLRAFLDAGEFVGGRYDVLRYVPLRRFTFRGELVRRPGRPVIGKLKRRSRVRLAHERAVAVARAAHAAGAPFAVAAPLGVDARHGIAYQGVVAGQPLSDLLGRGDVLEGLAHAGRIQRGFHKLAPRALPSWDPAAVLDGAARDLDWIAFLMPHAAVALEPARRALALAPTPTAPEDLVTCHGDFVCSHVYRDGDEWAVIDLDLAHRADAHWELGRALAALARDVPLLRALRSDPWGGAAKALARAQHAYVAGYREGGGLVDERRLTFWRLCGEIYELALTLTKDYHEPVAFARSLDVVSELGERVVAEGRA